MSRPIKHSDPLIEAVLNIEAWIARVRDHGAESVNYLNGDSDLFSGDAWRALDKHRKQLRAVLNARGIPAPASEDRK